MEKKEGCEDRRIVKGKERIRMEQVEDLGKGRRKIHEKEGKWKKDEGLSYRD